MKRKYTKSSEYWIKRRHANEPVEATAAVERPHLKYEWDSGEGGFGAIAACGGGTPTNYQDGRAPSVIPVDGYRNIKSGMLPWSAQNGYVNMSTAIELCQRCYFNVGIVRNAIELAVEFSCSKLHVKTSNTTVKNFFEEWLKKININSLSNQFFREYYRSGNVFLYKFVGRMSDEQFGKMKGAFAAKNNTLPIRYIILNPTQVSLQGGISFTNSTWVKVLSTYEIERLKSPQTPEDKQIFNSLPDSMKATLGKGSRSGNLYLPLDPKRLYYVFYKKQDYEPMAVPMIYPVLNDVEQKLELKKMDMSLSRTIEHVILLITTGEKKDQYGGGVNQNHIDALTNMFKNQTLGRTLVADYTTKGEWLIPPIGDILGPQKYEQVEKDIREGLQLIMSDGDKFANATIKAKVFIERMKEGQQAFLQNFLLPEVKKICQDMNFKNEPEIIFEDINLEDQSNRQRTFLRMAEVGILSPQELMDALETNVLPDKETNLINQKEYKKQRDDGLYYPLLGGSKMGEEGGDGRPAGTKSAQTTKKVGVMTAGDKFSTMQVAELTIKAENLKTSVNEALAKHYKLDSLNEVQSKLAESLTKSIISNEVPAVWNKQTIASYVKKPKEVNLDIGKEIDDISLTFDVTGWQAAILRHAKL